MSQKGMLKLKATKTISCEVCGSKIVRTKTFKEIISNDDIENSKARLKNKASSWQLTDKQKHCNICWSIVKKSV